METTKEITPLNPRLPEVFAQLTAFKAQVDEIGKVCSEIRVVDEPTLAIATQQLSKADKIVKTIEAKVKDLRKPYNDELKRISDLGESIIGGLKLGVGTLKSEIAEWEIKRKSEADKRQKKLDYINTTLTPKLKQLEVDATNADKCEEAISYINEKWPKDTWFGEFLDMANELKRTYLALLTTKKVAFSTNSPEAETLVLAQASAAEELAANNVQVQESVSLDDAASKTRGSRYLWSFEVQDIRKLPWEWLQVNEEQVKKYLAANKDKLKEGEVVSGIKFFKKLSIASA